MRHTDVCFRAPWGLSQPTPTRLVPPSASVATSSAALQVASGSWPQTRVSDMLAPSNLTGLACAGAPTTVLRPRLATVKAPSAQRTSNHRCSERWQPRHIAPPVTSPVPLWPTGALPRGSSCSLSLWQQLRQLTSGGDLLIVNSRSQTSTLSAQSQPRA